MKIRLKERKEKKKRLTANDIYELLVGEIGISRKEFLYDIRFWEVRRIIRGYRKRGRIYMQLLAENVYSSTFAFKENKDHITVRDMFPNLFDDEDDEIEPPITQEEAAQLQAEMEAINATNAASATVPAESSAVQSQQSSEP